MLYSALAEAGFALSAPCWHARSARGLSRAVGIAFNQKVSPAGVKMIFPIAKRDRPRQQQIPDTKSITAQAMLETAKWRKVSWRRRIKGALSERFAAVRVRIADGPPTRIRGMGAQHLSEEEVWVIGEHRSSGERKYYLSNLPAEASLKQLAGAIKARSLCEQTHQQLKEELGLDHIEERSRAGLHWCALTSMIAYAFLQSRRLKQAGGGKISGPPPQPTLPAVRTEILKIIQNLHHKHATIAENVSLRKICQSSASHLNLKFAA